MSSLVSLLLHPPAVTWLGFRHQSKEMSKTPDDNAFGRNWLLEPGGQIHLGPQRSSLKTRGSLLATGQLGSSSSFPFPFSFIELAAENAPSLTCLLLTSWKLVPWLWWVQCGLLEPHRLPLLEGSFRKPPEVQCCASAPLLLSVDEEQKYLEDQRGREWRSIRQS